MYVVQFLEHESWAHPFQRGSWQDHVVIPGIDLERCSGIEWKTVERPSYPYSPFSNIHAALNITSDDYTISDLHVADYSYEVTGSLDLDLTDETLMLLAQGSHQSGRLHVTTHTKPSRRAYAVVVVKFTSAAALAQMHLCKLSSKGVQGFGIHVRVGVLLHGPWELTYNGSRHRTPTLA